MISIAPASLAFGSDSLCALDERLSLAAAGRDLAAAALALGLGACPERASDARVAIQNDASQTFAGPAQGSLLFEACRQRDLPMASLLLLSGASHSRHEPVFHSCLHYACSAGDPELCLLLLRHGADPNALDPRGRPPLMDACEATYTRALEPERALAIQALAAHGAELDAAEPGGATALAIACLSGNLSSARALLLCGANPNAPTGAALGRASALLLVSRRLASDPGPEDAETAALLLEFGADPGQRDSDGACALDWMALCRDQRLRAAMESAALRDLLPPADAKGRSSL